MSKKVKNRRRRLIELYGLICQGCGQEFPDEELTVDHIRPKSKGGHRYAFFNLQLMCEPCNTAKADSWDGVSGVGADNPNERQSHNAVAQRSREGSRCWSGFRG